MNRIILTRPAVEAGERLGFLPGDLMAKVDPYLRPLYDALYDLLEPEGAQRLLDRGTIEVAPLAFMRGRTLNSSFIILDEAQNTTPEQMKMFLTRIGFGSKCVVTGDVTQIDVAGGRSGLVGLQPVLAGIEGMAFVHLTRRDVVRHKIVADIIDAYEAADASSAARSGNVVATGAARHARGSRGLRIATDPPAGGDRAKPEPGRHRVGGRVRRGRAERSPGRPRPVGPVWRVDVLDARGLARGWRCRCSSSTRRRSPRSTSSSSTGPGPTDVLAFPLEDDPVPSGRSPDFGGAGPGSEPEQEPLVLLGDVVVCPTVAGATPWSTR